MKSLAFLALALFMARPALAADYKNLTLNRIECVGANGLFIRTAKVNPQSLTIDSFLGFANKRFEANYTFLGSQVMGPLIRTVPTPMPSAVIHLYDDQPAHDGNPDHALFLWLSPVPVQTQKTTGTLVYLGYERYRVPAPVTTVTCTIQFRNLVP